MPRKKKNSRTVCVVTVFYKGQCFGSYCAEKAT